MCEGTAIESWEGGACAWDTVCCDRSVAESQGLLQVRNSLGHSELARLLAKHARGRLHVIGWAPHRESRVSAGVVSKRGARSVVGGWRRPKPNAWKRGATEIICGCPIWDLLCVSAPV
eukprot:6132973-Prymnesium_polylepis.2